MKRKNKFILVGIIIAIYVVIAINFNKIKYTLNMLSLYNEDQNIENNSKGNIKNEEDEDLVLVNPLEDLISDDPLETESLDVDEKKDNDETSPPTPSSGKSATASNKSYTSIVNDYNSRLENLKSSFQGDLDNLMAEGFEDYSKGSISKVQLASKYLSLGAQLEKSSDSQFKVLIKDMEKDLKKNNHDTSITKEIESYYASFKNSKKSNLISSGMNHLNN